jgi:hypothetical protein
MINTWSGGFLFNYQKQQVLAEPAWLTLMTSEDFRALTPLIYQHVNPYGIFELDLDKRLAIEPPTDSLAA